MIPLPLQTVLLCAVLSLLASSTGVYGDQNLVLESDQPITYTDQNKTIHAVGNASLKGDDFLVLAEEISWNRETGDALAVGKVSITRGDSRILADRVNLQTKTGDYLAINAVGGTPPKHFTAKTLESNGSIETYHHGVLYLSEPGLFEPNIRARNYTVDSNRSTFSISPAQVRIGNILIGILPGYTGNKRDGLGGVSSMIKVGKDGTLGWYGQVGFDYKWSDITTGATLTYYQDRGLLISPTITHSKSFEDGYINSRFKGGWVNDTTSSPGRDARGLPIRENRGYAHFTNLSRFSDRFRSSTAIEWEGDSEIIRDFRRNEFYSNQWNQSHNEMTYEGNGYSVSVFTKWQTNSHESMVEQLPLLTMDGGPYYKSYLYHSGSLAYGSLIQRDEYGAREPSIRRFNIGYKAEKPIAIANGLVLNPSLALLHQHYDLPTSNPNRSFFEYGLDLHAHFHQPLPYSNEVWEIDQMFHSMKLSIGYRGTDHVGGSSSGQIPIVNPEVEDLNLAPLDILDHKDSEIIREKEVIRFGWENNLFAKWNEANRRLLSMRAFYDVYNSGEVGTKDSDFMYADLSVHPAHWVSLNVRHKVDLQSGENYRKSYGLNLRDGRFQGASLSYLSYLDFNNYTYFSGWKRLNEKLFSSLSALYDLDQDFLTYWNGRFEYRTGSSWVWDFTITQRKGTSRENNTEFSIGLSLSGFKLNQLTEPDGLSSIYAM